MRVTNLFEVSNIDILKPSIQMDFGKKSPIGTQIVWKIEDNKGKTKVDGQYPHSVHNPSISIIMTLGNYGDYYSP